MPDEATEGTKRICTASNPNEWILYENRESDMRRMLLAIGIFLPGLAFAAETNGKIVGTIVGAKAGTKITAVSRINDKKFPGTIDAKAGKFAISGLPLGAAYDCVIDYGDRVLEGVNFAVPRSEYEEEQPLEPEDIETITKKVKSLNVFENVVEVLEIRGNIQHAAVLVNKVRTTPFYGAKPGEVIWRPELWHFQRPEEHWLKVQDELFIVLYRQRMPKSDYDKKSHTFDAELGGIILTADAPTRELGSIKPPTDKPGVRLRGSTLPPKN